MTVNDPLTSDQLGVGAEPRIQIVKKAWASDIWLIACMTNGTLDEIKERADAFSESLARRAVAALGDVHV